VNKILEAMGPEGFGNYEVDWSGSEPQFTRVSRPAQGVLIPGLIDLHIHGGFGIDFMSASEKELAYLCHVLEGAAYEGFLLTTITASARSVARALDRIPNHPAILGFHLEGPFISPKKFPSAPPTGIPFSTTPNCASSLSRPRSLMP
jgi:N-acetylglucosamine-6-phosphate deacetylase